MNMRFLAIATPAILVLSAAAHAQRPQHGQPPGAKMAQEEGRAGVLFRENCLACHQAPDLKFPTDRAWLNQVKDTA